MIIEGLVTCTPVGKPAQPHAAALGPVVNEQLTEWTLRPFQSSTIYSLLRDNPRCVFHTIDDALPIVQLVLGQSPALSYRQLSPGVWIIDQACHWFELEIEDWDISGPRTQATARLVQHADLRPFWGWNRAKHALLEAAILISRARLMKPEELRQQLDALSTTIEKTAGPRETAAWDLIERAFLA